MINNDILSTLPKYLKTIDLQQLYDENKNKLTANNYNYLVSSILELNQNTDAFDSQISTKVNTNYNQIIGIISNISSFLSGKISDIVDLNTIDHANLADNALTANIALSALSSNIALSALSAGISNKALALNNSIQFYTSSNKTVSFNGSIPLILSTILSSQLSMHAVSADISTNALSSQNAFESTSAIYAETADKVKNQLQWISAQQQEVGLYDGSETKTLSSVLFSVSSQLSNESLYSLSADFDSENYPLNTKVEYIFSQDQNYDFPLLFSEKQASKVQSNEKYGVKYHEQININPYLGAIKANYFIGTAVSATYAISDPYSNLVNTRVCQNSTQNNYNYPIALSFIKSDGQPADGQNNQLLYTQKMRINPYNDIIFTKAIPGTNESDIDYSIYIGTGENSSTFRIGEQQFVHKYKSHENYDVNLVGLATRAICDLSGYPINQAPMTYLDNVNLWKPIIFSGKSNYPDNIKDYVHDKLSYYPTILLNPAAGSINLSGALTCKQHVEAQTHVTSYGYMYTDKFIECGRNTTGTDTHGNDALVVHKNARIEGNLAVGTSATNNSKLQVFGTSIISKTLTCQSNINVSGVAQIKGATHCYGDLNAGAKTHLYSTLEVDGTSKFKNTITGTKFIGVATSAQWADLAENYETDMQYPIGTLVQFGGQKQITIASSEVNGVISDKPAYLMNSNSKGQPIALVGRVFVRVIGKVNKFDYIKLSDLPGIGISNGKNKTNIIGRALKQKNSQNEQLLQCVVRLEL